MVVAKPFLWFTEIPLGAEKFSEEKLSQKNKISPDQKKILTAKENFSLEKKKISKQNKYSHSEIKILTAKKIK